MIKTPIQDVWLAKNRLTGEYVFIEWGMKYDQKVFDLVLPVTANEVIDLIINGRANRIGDENRLESG
ncbi:hypothetical protein [Salmonella phage LVR16A]|uniref:Uncharacterized protein n=1 Tax=Salmonella phage LVR16A TaxID=2041204 RepID=A0A291LBV3_9CAUD|nr:hypothetical protein HOT54_gp082 [Salmonella phage LVR16A]ATI16610.1 hypothetical protein [Salmonella phage LVR16A]WDR21990.1 hypothetical protein PJM43_0063 [Salmonella phage vB_SenS_UTK0008]